MSKDKKILEATVQNLVTTTWHPGVVHPWQGMGVWAMTARDGGIKHKEKVKLYWIIFSK
jgi:hypothetical protein